MKHEKMVVVRKQHGAKNYIGTKIISAVPCTKYKYYGDSAQGDDEAGYKVYYPPFTENEKTYIGWSPKDVFDHCYREITLQERNCLLPATPHRNCCLAEDSKNV